MDIHVLIERTDTGYSAYAPDLPGCVAAGATIEETKRIMREAIEAYLHEIRSSGAPRPRAGRASRGRCNLNFNSN